MTSLPLVKKKDVDKGSDVKLDNNTDASANKANEETNNSGQYTTKNGKDESEEFRDEGTASISQKP